MNTSPSCLFLQMDEAEKLDKEEAEKPAGKNSLPSIPDCYQDILTGVALWTAFRHSLFMIRILSSL